MPFNLDELKSEEAQLLKQLQDEYDAIEALRISRKFKARQLEATQAAIKALTHEVNPLGERTINFNVVVDDSKPAETVDDPSKDA